MNIILCSYCNSSCNIFIDKRNRQEAKAAYGPNRMQYEKNMQLI